MLLQMTSDLSLRPAGTTEEGSRSFREVPREPSPWTPGSRLLSAEKRAQTAAPVSSDAPVGWGDMEVKVEREKAVCG